MEQEQIPHENIIYQKKKEFTNNVNNDFYADVHNKEIERYLLLLDFIVDNRGINENVDNQQIIYDELVLFEQVVQEFINQQNNSEVDRETRQQGAAVLAYLLEQQQVWTAPQITILERIKTQLEREHL